MDFTATDNSLILPLRFTIYRNGKIGVSNYYSDINEEWCKEHLLRINTSLLSKTVKLLVKSF